MFKFQNSNKWSTDMMIDTFPQNLASLCLTVSEKICLTHIDECTTNDHTTIYLLAQSARTKMAFFIKNS